MGPIRIGSKYIGDGHPCFIVFEAGATHDGFSAAEQLVRLAAEAGADAVKFQLVDPDRLIADKDMPFTYSVLLDRDSGSMQTVTEPLYDILCRRCMKKEEWRDIKKICDDLNIIFFATATFIDEVDFLYEIGCETIKICSGDVDYFQLIEYCASKGFILQFDTGNATLGEIERAIDVARTAGNDKVIVHNCPSGYPARLESINLRMILTMKDMLRCPIAFSDHTPGWDMDIAAVALGANMLEKTITLDRTTKSVEHVFSLEPEEMKQFVKAIRDLETALGDTRRIMSPEERHKALAVRRSLVTSRPLKGGETLRETSITYSRPGYGIRPEMTPMAIGRVVRNNLPKGHLLQWSDFS